MQAQVAAMQQVDGRILRSKWQRLQGPSQTVSLAISELLPEVFVEIETLWEDDEVLDKRKSEAGYYEFLVKAKGMSRACARWKHPKLITDPELVREFEETRSKQLKDKTHLTAWYPFKEELVVQWKDYPFFIVSYGGGQFNKFCVVGLDKTRTSLKCKNCYQANQPQHQVHIQMVQRYMTAHSLKLHHKTISSAYDLFLPPTVQDTTKSLNKPVSQQTIHLKSVDLAEIRRHLHQDSSSLPLSFTPKTHPEFCKCETIQQTPDGTNIAVFNTTYKATPEPVSKKTTLWLPHGPPITNRQAFVWRCKKENPKCNVFYDGHDDGIFNYSNSTMVSHSVMFEFLFSLVTG